MSELITPTTGEMSPQQMAKLLPLKEKPASEEEEKFLREICKWEFVNLEHPGLIHQFSYGTGKHRNKFTLVHGGVYDLPRFIAKHIDECTMPDYKYIPDGTGKMVPTQVGTVPRFAMRQKYSK